ncbi:MAG: cytochrome c [Bacteroidota bacterium]
MLRRTVIFLSPLILIGVLTAFQPQSSAAELSEDTSLEETIVALGGTPAAHQVKNLPGVSVEAGRMLVYRGVADDPDSPGKTRRQSKHFVCTSCHNMEKEDPDLRYADPEARLTYAVENDLPFLPGTTLYGVVNRRTFYNGDYEKKYGDLVAPARKDLRGSIALCATECAQGRELADWEMESVLAYLWTIDIKLGDLNMPESSMSVVQQAMDSGKDKAQALEVLESYYLDHSPATFLVPPPDRNVGYEEVQGDPARGRLVYESSCLHCHGERRYSFFNLDDTKYSFDFLEKHFPQYTRYSTYQVVRYGTSPMPGKRAYMPHYTEQRMSNQQVEDLRAYVSQRAD